MKISFLVLAVCSSQVVMSSAQIASNDPPPANSILRLQSGTNFVLKSTRADTSWLLIPEYRSSLSTTSWTTVPFFTNTIQNGTNTTVFGGQYIPADSNVFFRIRQTDDRASLYDGPPPLIANTWGYAGLDVDAGAVTNMVTSLTTLGPTNAGRWIVVLDVGWLTGSGRDQNGQLIGDTNKFPSGLKNLSKWLHEQGLGFGLYYHCGTNAESPDTFGGQASSNTLGYVEKDGWEMATNLFVDYVKLNFATYDLTPERNRDIQMAFLKALRASGSKAFVWIMPDLTDYGQNPFWLSQWGNDFRAYSLYDGNTGGWYYTLYNWRLVSQWFGTIRPGHLVSIESALANVYDQYHLSLLQSTMNMWAISSGQRIIENISPPSAQFFTNAEVNAIIDDIVPASLLNKTTNSGLIYETWLKPLHNGNIAVMMLNPASVPTDFEVASTNLGSGGYAFRDPWIHSLASTGDVFKATVPAQSTALYLAVPKPVK